MLGLSRTEVERIRAEYPHGTRVRLVSLEDPFLKIPKGTEGTVDFVDDIGQIHTIWDDYGCLAIIPEADAWEKI